MFLQDSALTLSDTLVVLGQVEIIYETKLMDTIYRALGEKTSYATKNKIVYIQEDGESHNTCHASQNYSKHIQEVCVCQYIYGTLSLRRQLTGERD
jgi:hypothetical protein